MGYHVGRLRCTRKGNIKMDLKEIGMKVKWFCVTEVRVLWLAYVNVLRNF